MARQCQGYSKSVEQSLKKLALLAGRGHGERREIERMLRIDGMMKMYSDGDDKHNSSSSGGGGGGEDRDRSSEHMHGGGDVSHGMV